jgi:RNA polymerase sigma-70 factor, ECF subfamily
MTMTSPPAPSGESGQTHKLPTDAELLSLVGQPNQAAGQAAFRELVNRHGRYLYGVAHSLVGNGADAEDLVQETLIAALGSKFRGESAVRTWLVGILVRRAGMLHRTRRRHVKAMTLLGNQQQVEQGIRGGTSGGGSATELRIATEGSAGGTDARLDLSVMLERLSPEHRRVIVLRELEGMSYEQIAAALDVPRGTVESRLHRAREDLRRRFKGYQP